MEFTTDKEKIETCVNQLINLIENNINYNDNGYTVGQIPDGRGIN